MQICQSLIGGKPVTSPLPAIDKIYPATGAIVAKIEPATQEMLDEAVAVATFAQRSWAVYEPLARARILHRAAALMTHVVQCFDPEVGRILRDPHDGTARALDRA